MSSLIYANQTIKQKRPSTTYSRRIFSGSKTNALSDSTQFVNITNDSENNGSLNKENNRLEPYVKKSNKFYIKSDKIHIIKTIPQKNYGSQIKFKQDFIQNMVQGKILSKQISNNSNFGICTSKQLIELSSERIMSHKTPLSRTVNYMTEGGIERAANSLIPKSNPHEREFLLILDE